MYYKLKTDLYSDYGIIDDPELPDGVSFLTGGIIQYRPDKPLRFVTNCNMQNPPRGHLEGITPVWSEAMLKAFLLAGVDNVQAFPAILTDYEGMCEWEGYYAINIIGMVAAADMDSSQYISIGERPGGLPFVGFQNIVIDKNKTHDLNLFRLAESPTEIIISACAVDSLSDSSPSQGWGISVIELSEN